MRAFYLTLCAGYSPIQSGFLTLVYGQDTAQAPKGRPREHLRNGNEKGFFKDLDTDWTREGSDVWDFGEKKVDITEGNEI